MSTSEESVFDVPQPLIDMETLWEQRYDEAAGDTRSSPDDLPPLEWIEEMTECLRVLVQYGDVDAAYGTCDHAWCHAEMIEFIESAPGTHPTWKAFQAWALDVLHHAE